MATKSAASDTTRASAYTIRPRLHAPIRLSGLPNAACTIAPEGEGDPRHALKAFSGPDGEIRFSVHFAAETDDIARLVVTSKAGRKTTRQQLHLRSGHEATEAMPFPPQRRAQMLDLGANVRPALSYEEALRISDEQAIKRGYPLRPNPDETPQAFDSWLRSVSTPMRLIEPHLITNPDISHGKALITAGPASSNNWSGFELDRSITVAGAGPRQFGLSPPYDWVKGAWSVPAVSGELGQTTYSALWVGLDGDGVADLVQAGTEQDCVLFLLPPATFITLSTFYAWTEFLPQQPTEQIINNFPVNAGDHIVTEVWIGNAGSAPTPTGAFGCFLIMNLTTSMSTRIYTPVGSTRVGGSEAVWIMERPTVGGGLPDLANYGSALMTDALARVVNSPKHQGYVAYQGRRNKQISMLNGGATLSTVTAIDATSMRFNWQAFH